MSASIWLPIVVALAQEPEGVPCLTAQVQPRVATSWSVGVELPPGATWSLVELRSGPALRSFRIAGARTERTHVHRFDLPASAELAGMEFTVQALVGSPTRACSPLDIQIAPLDPRPWKGLTLQHSGLPSGNPSVNPTVEVLDMNATVVQTWADPLPGWGYSLLSKPLSNGGLLSSIYDRSTSGQTIHKTLIEQDTAGQIVWQCDPSPLIISNDFERQADGTTLIVAYGIETWPAVNPNPIFSDYVLTADASGTVVDSWGLGEHYADLPLSSTERDYLASVQPEPGAPAIVFHLSSMATLPPNRFEATDPRFAAGNWLISLRESSLVFIWDVATQSTVWTYRRAIGQHHVRMIPRGLPGAGNILIFDNGGTAGAPPVTRNHSRILEVDPSTGDTVWSYVNPLYFFSPAMGACQRLPNGNTFVTDAWNGELFEIDNVGNLLWTLGRGAVRLYRAYRIDEAWTSSAISFPW